MFPIFTDNPSYSNRELYYTYETLSSERMEYLLTLEEESKNASDIAINVQEAIAQYPEEDSLHNELNLLRSLSKRLRGDNRESLVSIISTIEDTIQRQVNASEYGIEQLRKLMK